MRNAMIRAISDIAKNDSDLMLLTADLGFSVFEEFEENFPNQFINVGIAEQNMIGVAAGLALEGKKVFVYSIGNFPTIRCLEQIRNDICYHNLNVNIIGMGAGFSYGALGFSHHATEDLTILRSLPNMTVIAPSGVSDTCQLINQIINRPGPSYLRLDKTVSSSVKGKVEIGRMYCNEPIRDVVVFAIGGIALEVESALSKFNKREHKITVVYVHTLKPLDEEFVIKASKSCSFIITIEENSLIGGLGSAINDIILQKKLDVRCINMGIKDTYLSEVGDQAYLRSLAGISSSDIEKVISKCGI